jgi:formate-dependent nitrite reductase membrane component NrfD
VAQWAELLAWLEQSALGNAIRGSGVWTYGMINLAHILGIATLFGAVLILDLRLLGVKSQVPLVSITGATVPLTVVGFCLAVLSGICMLSTNGSQYADNPFLPIKFAAIALASINAGIASRSAAWRNRSGLSDRRQRGQLKLIGGVSLCCWLAAVAAGRLIGYW